MFETSVTILGRLTKDPELADTNGKFRCSFRLASNERRWDRALGEYVDGPTVFISVTCWRTTAQNAAQSLGKGDPVVVLGRLRQHSYVNKDGQTVSLTEIDADVVALDLRKGLASRLRRVARPADADHSFDAPPAEGAGVAAPEGMAGIDGESIDVELSQLAGEELVGASADTPF